MKIVERSGVARGEQRGRGKEVEHRGSLGQRSYSVRNHSGGQKSLEASQVTQG